MEEELAEILRNSFSLYETGQFVGVRRSEFLASAILAAGYAKRSDVVEDAGLFCVGECVEKYTGDYQLSGEVRARFSTKAGKIRYVVEHEPGFLHIYGPANIRNLKDKP